MMRKTAMNSMKTQTEHGTDFQRAVKGQHSSLVLLLDYFLKKGQKSFQVYSCFMSFVAVYPDWVLPCKYYVRDSCHYSI